jgi:hypothetical protein
MTSRDAKQGWQWLCSPFLSTLLCSTLLCPAALAQTTSTTILGTVADSSGAVLPNAKVTVVNTQTGVRREDTTSSTGDFTFPLLDVGVYDITVDAQGFKTEVRRGIVLQINDKTRADFALQVGATSERVEVVAENAALRTDDATLGQTVEQRRVEELPLNNRNIGALAILQPGVQYGPRSGTDGQGFGQRQGSHGIPIPGIGLSFVANGQRETNQHATLDGVVATEARVNTIPFSPSVEAVQEFRVLSGSYSAEYGFNAGAQTIIVTKSGTNEWHGSAFEFLRNDVFDAENYFQNYFNAPGAPRIKKDSLRQNNYGGVLTGPLWIPKLYDGHNQTFFMFNYEARRRRQGGLSQQANHPTTAFRNGDFSSLLSLPTPIRVVDPLTGDPFPGNIIPAGRISPVAKELMKFWPEPQRTNANPLVGFNYTGFERRTLDDDQIFVRGDHHFSENDKIFGRYAYNDVSYGVIPGDNPNFTYFVAGRNQNVGTGWIHIFTPSFINELRYGYNRSVNNTLNPRANTDFDVNRLGLTGFRVVNDGNRPFTARETGVPTITVNGFSTLAEQDGGNGFDFNNLHQISDNVTWSKAAHNYKFGFDFRNVRLYRGAANVPRGGLTFGGDIAGTGFAAFLLGYPSSTTTPEGLPVTETRQNRFAVYAQDDWKATRKLTLNLGLRWEYNTPAVDILGLWRSLSFTQLTNGLPTVVPNIGEEYEFYEAQKTLFMPRLGFAYRWTDDWVFRGGFGIYYNVHQLNNYTILNLNPPKSGTSNFVQTATGGRINAGQTVLTYASPFGVVNPTSATGINALSPDNNQPYVTQWSLDIQRRLPFDAVLSVGYVGNKGTHIDNTVELNAPRPALSSNPTPVNSRRPIPAFADGPGGPRRTLNRLRWLTSDANSWYHGLQVNLQKRFTGGFQFNLAYTYSKAMGEGYGRNEGGGAIPNSYQNPTDRAAEKTRYGFDFRHSAVVSFLYEVPVLDAFRDNAAKYFFGGWQLNSIVVLRTGLPFSVTQNNTINTVEGHVRPDRLSSGKLDNPTVNQWFNPDAFLVVTCQRDDLADRCHYGNAGQGILEGPGFKNVDFSLLKNIPVKERLRLQFRAEIFNLFNTPQFAVPNSSLNAANNFLPAVGSRQFPSQANIARGPGAITSIIAPMRQMQFGLKLIF